MTGRMTMARGQTFRKLSAILLLCACSVGAAHAAATLFLGEPYSYDGALAGTGHASIYLSDVCAKTPVELRPCAPGETGIVISRYHRVAGYDWIAIPLVPYLYAVENEDDLPLFADKKMVAFLRDRYRRKYLEALAPDLPDGGTPEGDWYELVGASYIRTIYAYEFETTPEQDAALIRKLNAHVNHDHFNLVTSNCADFARNIIDFYQPHAVHRSIIGDLGVTTPKQLARTLSKYSRKHPELEPSNFVIPQVPGNVPRSKPVHGVLECALTAKKYMLPVFALHPYIAGMLIAGYWGHGRFNPAQNALVLDANHQLDEPPTKEQRRNLQARFEELMHGAAADDAGANTAVDDHRWAASLAAADPSVDSSGRPVLQTTVDGAIADVGAARVNVMGVPDTRDFAAGLVEARLREELKSAPARKSSRADVENDLALLQQLISPRRITVVDAEPVLSQQRGSEHATQPPVAHSTRLLP